ncbi:rhomboid family intramembrane serine protease [Kangiella profundi]|uniref:rhomboid family intramembrane serine protease n=1 Tax=Kangiella profundi TaxID=1561924 RepID=UPI001D0D373F|nr:rhomboid family intramembrane serine protease [Kangiella profundi]
MTAFLIIINCIVFFALQSGDDEIFYQAIEFYVEEDLLTLEQEAFEEYTLEEKGEIYDLLINPKVPQEALVPYILSDDKFAIYVKTRSDYSIEWRTKREELEAILENSITENYSFSTTESSLLTAFTSMFLHGDYMHLFSNMVFLFLFGYNLELLIGRPKMLALYILSGFAAVGFFYITSGNSATGLLGASGAIAGLMGGFAAWYGLKSIRYFYWFLVYFNYIRLPGALALLFFLAKEVIYDISSEDNVAYMAHFGGLIGGAICVWLFKLMSLNREQSVTEVTESIDIPIEDDSAERVDEHYRQGLTATQNLDFEQAKTHFYAILNEQPHNKDVLNRLYNLEKTSPESTSYARLCADILQVSIHNDSLAPLAEQCLDDLKHNGVGFKPIPANILLDFARKQVRHKKTEPIKPIISLLVQHYSHLDKLPDLLLHFAFAAGQNGDWQGKQKVLGFVSKKYPDTFAGQEAKKALQEA